MRCFRATNSTANTTWSSKRFATNSRDSPASYTLVIAASAGVKNVIAVSSGKGGVGKSTVAVNLAAGLSQLGARVGLFDADIYGPNVPRMVDADEPPGATEDETLVPPEKYGVKLMSMAFLTGEDDPVIWRGPMVHKVITQLTEDVEWGALDYLVVDLPPRRAMVNPPTPIASVAMTIAIFASNPASPTSGAAAFGTLLAPR